MRARASDCGNFCWEEVLNSPIPNWENLIASKSGILIIPEDFNFCSKVEKPILGDRANLRPFFGWNLATRIEIGMKISRGLTSLSSPNLKIFRCAEVNYSPFNASKKPDFFRIIAGKIGTDYKIFERKKEVMNAHFRPQNFRSFRVSPKTKP